MKTTHIDPAAPACDMSIRTTTGRARCTSVRAEYTVRNRQASRKCLGCGHVSRRDVTIDMVKKCTTAETLRTFWVAVDNAPA
jgi:hypothetical protein